MKLVPWEKTVLALLAMQLVVVLSVILLEPGFDHPNSLGLDFNFIMISAAAFATAWFVGFVLACRLSSRRWVHVCAYLMSPLLSLGLLAYSEGGF